MIVMRERSGRIDDERASVGVVVSDDVVWDITVVMCVLVVGTFLSPLRACALGSNSPTRSQNPKMIE